MGYPITVATTLALEDYQLGTLQNFQLQSVMQEEIVPSALFLKEVEL